MAKFYHKNYRAISELWKLSKEDLINQIREFDLEMIALRSRMERLEMMYHRLLGLYNQYIPVLKKDDNVLVREKSTPKPGENVCHGLGQDDKEVKNV